MHSRLKRLLKIILFTVAFAAGTFAVAPASRAACCGEVAAIWGATGAQTLAINTWIEKVIMGTKAVNKVFPRMIPGEFPGEERLPMLAIPPLGLVDYFENIFRPWMLEMEQRKGQEAARMNAATLQSQFSAMDANNTVGYSRDLDIERMRSTVDGADRTSVICPDATKAGAIVALEPISNLQTFHALKAASEDLDGSSKNPMVANGLVTFYNELITKRNSMGLCNPEGNNNIDGEFCKGGKDSIKNADTNPSVLTLSLTLQQQNLEEPNHMTYAKMYLDNLFGFVFTPLRLDQVKGNIPNYIAEAIYDRLKFSSQILTLRKPFEDDFAKRKELAGFDGPIKQAYEKTLELIGITGGAASAETRKLFTTQDGKWSPMAIEKIFYKDANLDPSEYGRLGGWSVLNLGNVVTYQTIKTMHSVALLYDIRQEIRETNKLLGALGSLLATDRHQAIEAKIQAVAGN